MRGLPRTRWVAVAAALALAVSACGGDDDDDGGEAGPLTGEISFAGCEPQNPLIPTNTNETCGGDLVQVLFTGLVSYSPDDASPGNAVAESIESDDNTTWTVKLKQGWTFHDGTPVTAKSFVDAWNWGAYGPNAQLNSYFFGLPPEIEGFTEVQGTDANGDEAITEDEAPVKEMSGLTVVNDYEFTVTLTGPSSTFPTRLGYSAFAPLPESFFSDTVAFGENPVGNGPFKFVSWSHNTEVRLTANEDYAGEDKAQVKDIRVPIYQSLDAAYTDLVAGNVDLVDSIASTSSALTGGQYLTDLGDRIKEQTSLTISTITIPTYVPEYDNNADLGKAISMAIDRETIIEQIFSNTREPASSWVPPVVKGYTEGQCGDFCTYNQEQAQQLFGASGFTGTLTLGYNADGGHKEWVEATCNSISNVLGVDCVPQESPDFATFRDVITNREEDGMFRTGWQADYPHIENFLAPLYATGGSANDGDYSNPDFDALISEAAALPDEEAIPLYQEAERLLAEDMTVIPLWYGKSIGGYTDRIDGSALKMSPFGFFDLTTAKLAG